MAAFRSLIAGGCAAATWVALVAVPVVAAPVTATTTGFGPERFAARASTTGGATLARPIGIDPLAAVTADAQAQPVAGRPSSRRAQVLLRSITLPGWGQATLGQRTSATVFGLIETGVWASFGAFRVQERLRKDEYQRTARLFAGIDLDGRDEEYRRIVGSYLSSEEYNRLVVFRDAANQHYDDPEAYRQYIAEHEVTGADAWSWTSVDDLLRYRRERKDAQRSAKRAQAALIAGVANRLISAAHAARGARRLEAAESHGWRLEIAPRRDDPTAFAIGLRTNF